MSSRPLPSQQKRRKCAFFCNFASVFFANRRKVTFQDFTTFSGTTDYARFVERLYASAATEDFARTVQHLDAAAEVPRLHRRSAVYRHSQSSLCRRMVRRCANPSSRPSTRRLGKAPACNGNWKSMKTRTRTPERLLSPSRHTHGARSPPTLPNRWHRKPEAMQSFLNEESPSTAFVRAKAMRTR